MPFDPNLTPDDLKLYLDWFCKESPQFAAYWKRNCHQSLSFFEQELGRFQLAELRTATEQCLLDDLGKPPTGWRQACRAIAGQAALNRRRTREAEGRCVHCWNRHYVSVISPQSLDRVAKGLPCQVVSLSMPCGCLDGQPDQGTFQQAREQGNCVIPFTLALDGAVELEREFMQYRGPDRPLPEGLGAVDLTLCRVLFDWILAHRKFRHGTCPLPSQVWPRSEINGKVNWFQKGLTDESELS